MVCVAERTQQEMLDSVIHNSFLKIVSLGMYVLKLVYSLFRSWNKEHSYAFEQSALKS